MSQDWTHDRLVSLTHDLLILGWHNVESTWCFPSNPGRGSRGLAAQLRSVRTIGQVIDLGEAVTTLSGGRILPRRSIALTFDDGYRDNLTIAAPLLRELGLPATFFLVPSVLSGVRTPWWETLAAGFQMTSRPSLRWHDKFYSLVGTGKRSSCDAVSAQLKSLDRASREAAVTEIVDLLEPEGRADVAPLFLDWDNARELVSKGFAIGSHSLNHAILANETPRVQREDLGEARRQLEAQLEVPVDLLAYPNGTADDFNVTTEGAARDVGYRCGVTTIPGWNSHSTSPYRLRRHVLFPERGRFGFKSVAKRAAVESLSSVRRGWF